MYAKRLKRKCSVRGCKNTDTFAISRTRELGASVIICKSCLGKALGVIDDINPETGSNIEKTTGGKAPSLFYNAEALGKPADVLVDAEIITPTEDNTSTDDIVTPPADTEDVTAPETPTDAPTEDNTSTDETNGFVCPNCGRSFDTEQGLKTHLRFCKEKSDE